ncbi:MAG: NAD+ synthase [Myxococcales bacterium]|nr:NAD+ synthase [Myxococcales bacterium]
MRLALAQLNVTIGDFENTVAAIGGHLDAARAAGADLVLFPELAICGYPPLDLLGSREFVERTEAALASVARKTTGCCAIVGFVAQNPTSGGKPVFNAAALCVDGAVDAVYHKRLLPNYDVFDENRWFQAGSAPLVRRVAGVDVGVSICEDIWNDKGFWERPLYHVDPIEELVRAGAQLVLNLSASPYALDKDALRYRMVREVARRHAVPVAFINLVGGNDSLVFDGSSFVVDAGGALVARARSFEEELLLVDLPLSSAADSASGRTAPSSGGESSPPRAVGEVPVDTAQSGGVAPATLPWPAPPRLELLHAALVLGIHDYLAKSGFQRVVIGLSGGIDSALTAALAADAVGPSNVFGIAMPSPYSSAGSLADARELATNLGIGYTEIPIAPIFDAVRRALAPLFGDRDEDVAEENIQARIRGLLVMAYANKFGALALTTGNKSELAVGYCTLYGDMCGGLAPIADLPKMLVYELARHLNREQPRIPESSLSKPPSAELRPGQLDQDSLPPYPLLDAILEAFVVEQRDADAIIGRAFPPDVVERVLRLVDRSEYKRRQAAPGIKVTSKAFGFGRQLPMARRTR